MKTIMIAIATLALSATAAYAGSKTVYYPKKACAEIVSQEYSSGGGDTAFHYLEILCKDAEGNYKGFVDSWGSVAGAFGLGRVSMPDVFIYVPHNSNYLSVE